MQWPEMHNTIGVVTHSPTAIYSVYYSTTLILNQIYISAFQKIKPCVLSVASKKPVRQQQPSHCQGDESQQLQAVPMPTKSVLPLTCKKVSFTRQKTPHHSARSWTAWQTPKNPVWVPSNFSHSAGRVMPTSEESGIFRGWQKNSGSTLSIPEYTLKASSSLRL